MMFEADGGNEIVHIMDRVIGTILAGFGAPGLQAGQFTFLHTVAKDSKGNLYTGETINGRRMQKFMHVECDNGNGRATATETASDAAAGGGCCGRRRTASARPSRVEVPT